MNVGDEYYEVSFDTPPFEREAVQVADALGVSLAGVKKITISFVRDPLDSEVLHAKSSSTRSLLQHEREPSLFDSCETHRCS